MNDRDILSATLPGLRAAIEANLAAPPPQPPGPLMSIADERVSADATVDTAFNAYLDLVPPLEHEVDHQVAVEGGAITVRSYLPDDHPDRDDRLPALVYFHGGGWWMGRLEHVENTCRSVARDVGCAVVSVAYRLAPEHKFPVPLHDCYAALSWVVQYAPELRIDTRRVAVGGGSAGGNLAAAVALLARDRRTPEVIAQVLELPATDLTLSQPSVEENATVPVLTKADYDQCVGWYLADRHDATDPYASPLLAADLSGLPPALIMTAELDVLRDDGEEYARRLRGAGVDVDLVRWPGQFHGTQNLAKLIPDEAAAYHTKIVDWLCRAFGA